MGCGAVKCNSNANNGANGWLLFCEYEPRGNVVGEFERNVGKMGQGKDGEPGFGAASRISGCSRWLVALVAVSSLALMCV